MGWVVRICVRLRVCLCKDLCLCVCMSDVCARARAGCMRACAYMYVQLVHTVLSAAPWLQLVVAAVWNAVMNFNWVNTSSSKGELTAAAASENLRDR